MSTASTGPSGVENCEFRNFAISQWQNLLSPMADLQRKKLPPQSASENLGKRNEAKVH